MVVTLRRATSADADELADLYLRSRTELASYAPLAHSDAAVRDWVANVLVPSGDVTVAVDRDTIVGLAAQSEADGIVWLDQLYVCPSVKRRGIGTLLLKSVTSRTRLPVQLYTFAMNRTAAAFYERHAFVAIAHRDASANEEGCPDVLYRLAR